MSDLLQNKEKLKIRARRKFLNTPLLKHLIDLDSPLRKAYWTTVHCSSKIHTHDGKVCSRYCKRTWCKVCSPIRTAVRLNNYRKALEDMGDLLLTTLTMPNVRYNEIKDSVKQFRKIFRQFRDTYKKREGVDFRGVYNFECTFNHRTGLYHPHIHIIHECIPILEKTKEQTKKGYYQKIKVDGQEVIQMEYVNELVEYWLKKCPSANIRAQDTRRCTDLIEGFKYQSLSVFKIKINGKKQPFIPVAELDQIYQQLQGVRCFQPFGIRKVSEEDEEKQMEELTAYDVSKPDGVYVWQIHDWHLTSRNDIVLSEFVPDKKTLTYYQKLEKNDPYKRTKIEVPN